MALSIPRLVVAALRGGSGKTTLTLGLLSALKKRGLTVAPFKKGPDYIDPFWHSRAAGMPCRNLDPYLMGREQVIRSFTYHAKSIEAALIEGNRGLFDGKDAQGSFSTAELAKWLKAPVVLSVDCSMASRTIAAVVMGCLNFDRELNLAGVILNPVANSRQERVVRDAIEASTGLSVLGAVPRMDLKMPERHMGLVPPQEHSEVAESLNLAAQGVAGHVNVDQILELMGSAPLLPESGPPMGLFPEKKPKGPGPVIAVVKDEAFGFYYQENLEALKNHGAELVYCSALRDKALPDCQAVYLGGGFPETHASILAQNRKFMKAIRSAAGEGLPIYAECGGLMYLGRRMVVNSQSFPMAGIFKVDFHMQKKPAGHGYSVFRVSGENPFFEMGSEIKAHEFHYSKPQVQGEDELASAYEVVRGKGILGSRGGLIYKNVLGTYHHVHALGTTGWAAGVVAAAQGREVA